MIWFFLVPTIWLLSGFVAAGLERAFFEERYRRRGRAGTRPLGLEIIAALLGPLSLIASVLTCSRWLNEPRWWCDETSLPPGFFPYGWTSPLARDKGGDK